INECDLRTEAGFGITVNKILLSDASALIKQIEDIGKDYVKKRLEELRKEIGFSVNPEVAGMTDMLDDPAVIVNSVDEMKKNAEKYVSVVYDTEHFLRTYDDIIFESGQGLLLDPVISPFSPHVTASRTGLHNPMKILSENGLKLSEAVYVTRSYVTRHGAGPLPYECDKEKLGKIERDLTNEDNPWQGSIRYARHGDCGEFAEPVKKDIEENSGKNFGVILFVTHLNETDGKLLLKEGDYKIAELDDQPMLRIFDGIRQSYSREN
ncbi:MAG: adenylosuccinate synthetase, partial [Lachnospiraceae bacterium]|nr:adenylosuccinate synthetase [Lachnospiraceae bacterium]